MSDFIKAPSKKPKFSQKGLDGYNFTLSSVNNIEMHMVDIKTGHNTYIISKKCTHIYYIVEGSGTFDIDGKMIKVSTGNLIEVPPNVKYTYSGKMKALLIMDPPWFEGNEEILEKNPDVE
jgi:mannose-6-phosphate isomerase-like protein (cupin superfamily)